MSQDMIDYLYKKATLVARKYYRIYKNIYLLESIDCKDLEQEASITVFEVINNKEYKGKSEEDILKITNQAIRFKLNTIRNTVQKHKEIFMENMEETITDNFFPQNKSKYDLSELKGYIDDKEYNILHKKLIEGKTYREIAKELKISFQAVAKSYNKIVKKLKKLSNRENWNIEGAI